MSDLQDDDEQVPEEMKLKEDAEFLGAHSHNALVVPMAQEAPIGFP